MDPSILGALLSAMALIWAIYTYLKGSHDRSSIIIILLNEFGDPQSNITLLGPQGDCVSPDTRGIASLPRFWIDKKISVHDKVSFRELTNFQLQENNNELFRVIVPGKDENS